MKSNKKILLVFTTKSNKTIKDFDNNINFDGIYFHNLYDYIIKSNNIDNKELYNYIIKAIKNLYKTIDKGKDEIYILMDYDLERYILDWKRFFDKIKSYKNIVFIN